MFKKTVYENLTTNERRALTRVLLGIIKALRPEIPRVTDARAKKIALSLCEKYNDKFRRYPVTAEELLAYLKKSKIMQRVLAKELAAKYVAKQVAEVPQPEPTLIRLVVSVPTAPGFARRKLRWWRAGLRKLGINPYGWIPYRYRLG